MIQLHPTSTLTCRDEEAHSFWFCKVQIGLQLMSLLSFEEYILLVLVLCHEEALAAPIGVAIKL